MVQAIRIRFPTAGAKLGMREKAAWSLGWIQGIAEGRDAF
jgi:hypothetical protein